MYNLHINYISNIGCSGVNFYVIDKMVTQKEVSVKFRRAVSFPVADNAAYLEWCGYTVLLLQSKLLLESQRLLDVAENYSELPRRSEGFRPLMGRYRSLMERIQPTERVRFDIFFLSSDRIWHWCCHTNPHWYFWTKCKTQIILQTISLPICFANKQLGYKQRKVKHLV